LAGRSGNWHLRNYALKKMVPVFHLVPSTIYYKLLPRHLADLLKYPTSVLSHLEAGGFVMSLSGTSWSKRFLDESHETTINRDVKEVVRNLDYAKISTKLHYIPFRACAHKNFFELFTGKMNKHVQSKDSPAYIKGFEGNVKSYMGKLSNSTLFTVDCEKCNDPENPTCPLQHLFSTAIASQDIRDSLLSLKICGDKRTEEHIKCFITHESLLRKGQKRAYKFVYLKNFGAVKKQTRSEINLAKVHQANIDFLSRMIDWCHRNQIPPDDIKQFTTLPLTISTPMGLPVTDQKAKVQGFYKKHFTDAFIYNKLPNNIDYTTFIVDGMFILHNNYPSQGQNTFGEYALRMFKKWVSRPLRDLNYSSVHIAFDRQANDIETPKIIERERRDATKTQGSVYHEVCESTYLPSSWANFIANRNNKKLIIMFLTEYFLSMSELSLCPSEKIIISGGCSNPNDAAIAFVIINDSGEFEHISALTIKYNNTHIEADQKVWFHAAKCPDTNIVIYSPDTDVFHVGLPFVEKYPTKHYLVQLKDFASEKIYLNVNKLIDLMNKNTDLKSIDSKNIPLNIQTLFICSGCDFVSFFRHYTKNRFYDAFFDNCDFITASDEFTGSLDQTDIDNWTQGLLAFYRLVGSVFLKKCAFMFVPTLKSKINPTPIELYKHFCKQNPNKSEKEIVSIWLDAIRRSVMKVKGCTSEDYWVPSDNSLELHWMRTCYVKQIWLQADISAVNYPDITQWGWTFLENGSLSVKWDSDHNFRNVENYRKLWTSGCHCLLNKKICGDRKCGCVKMLRPCGPACTCTSACNNKPDDPSVDALLKARYPENNDNTVSNESFMPICSEPDEEADPEEDSETDADSEGSEDDDVIEEEAVFWGEGAMAKED
jgi:hypothetical protein